MTPESADDIYEKHHLNTNESILWFQHTGELNQKLADQCQQATVPDILWPRIKAHWWPADLLNMKIPATPRHIFYRCNNENGYVAVNPRDKAAFYWRLH